MAKDNKKPLLPKSTLIIRFIAGMYLIYLAYELLTSFNVENGAPLWVSITAAVLFAVCGVFLAFFSGKAFIKGNFQGGIMDVAEQETEENSPLKDTPESGKE